MQGVETYVLDSNPVLEAFGNAKTTRNINSSRFGKFIQVDVSTQSGDICNASILTQLLEKSRAVSVADHERSFHIFYQGLASAEVRSKYGVASADPSSFQFLKSKTGTYTIDGVNDQTGCELTLACMRNIGFTEEEIDQIWRIIFAVLQIGNVAYTVNDNDEAELAPASAAFIQKAAELLQFDDPATLTKILSMKVVKYPGQVIESKY